MPHRREVRVALPAEIARADGLAYSLWLPESGSGSARRGPGPAHGGVVILHGAGSCKESHHDFARLLVAHGLAAIAFDQRGHGESGGSLDGRALDDVTAMGALLRSRLADPHAPLALRGSSMGGYLAIVAAAPVRARGVVAICPASWAGLRRALHAGNLGFEADVGAVDALLAEHDEAAAVAALEVPLLLMHAEGDEQVPVEHSRELAARARHPLSRLVAVPGGHHRSVQHDPELQALSVRFIERALG